jgi:hypothetical protein
MSQTAAAQQVFCREESSSKNEKLHIWIFHIDASSGGKHGDDNHSCGAWADQMSPPSRSERDETET